MTINSSLSLIKLEASRSESKVPVSSHEISCLLKNSTFKLLLAKYLRLISVISYSPHLTFLKI